MHPTLKTSESIGHQKATLQEEIKNTGDFEKQLKQIDKQKKQHFKEFRGFDNTENLKGKLLTQSKLYKEWRQAVNAEYKEKIDALKEALSEQYTEKKKKILDDYPIFMAIAEDIGYDATGKKTKINELDYIGTELARFIEAIEKGEE